MWDIMEARGEGGVGQKERLKKKLGDLTFIVFEYKTDIANTCNNSRIVRIKSLSQYWKPI